MTTSTAHQMTEQEATNEAVLLFTRKLMRLEPEAHARIMSLLPAEARWALTMAENAADSLRDRTTDSLRKWPKDEDEDEEA